MCRPGSESPHWQKLKFLQYTRFPCGLCTVLESVLLLYIYTRREIEVINNILTKVRGYSRSYWFFFMGEGVVEKPQLLWSQLDEPMSPAWIY